MDKEKTGNLIREARVKRGYTQLELGTMIGVSNKTVSKWEKGESFPDVGILESLSVTLQIGINDLVVGEIRDDSNRQEEITAEVLRIAKLQKKERMKDYIRFTIGGLIIVYSIIINFFSLASKWAVENMTGIYFISLAVLFGLVLIERVRLNKCSEFFDKVSRSYLGRAIVSVISIVLLILITIITIYFFEYSNATIPNQESVYIQILRSVYVIVFIINVGILFLDLCKYKAKSLKLDVFVAFAGLYLVGLYSFTLRNMSDVLYAQRMIVVETVIVAVEVGLALILLRFGKNKMEK